MKRMMMVALLIVPCMAVASESQNRIKYLLDKNQGATELDWQKKNLGNQDFEGLGMVIPSVTLLNLSNNSFTGEFPLTQCLTVFPKLKTLTLNDNTRMTGFAIESDYKNTTLENINAENSGFEELNLNKLYGNFELEILDLSESKQLTSIRTWGVPSRYSQKVLSVHLRNVAIPEVQLGKDKKITDGSTELYRIKMGVWVGLCVVGTTLLIPCIVLAPNYCVQGPIPPFQYDYMSPRNWANYVINTVALPLLSFPGGWSIGGAIGRCFLKNGGQVTQVKFITNSTDDTV